jgi:hypothetical protein
MLLLIQNVTNYYDKQATQNVACFYFLLKQHYLDKTSILEYYESIEIKSFYLHVRFFNAVTTLYLFMNYTFSVNFCSKSIIFARP